MSDDPVLEGYREWLNEALFEAKRSEGEFLMWLGKGRWILAASEGPDVFVITMQRGRIET